ncbi:MAG: hypothetical protein EZS28_020375 [Streblomastix strix]|uniref:Uncharacterized protein n=1 Tax=Streblomastix strix TaxID=222440 RepID=A0A5J4VNB5_9EUKA|nr:MAG: hypothetical protein EZS28_020375 [Streblomastix strix]
MNKNSTNGFAIYQNLSNNSVKPEPSELGLFGNLDTPKFTTKTPIMTAIEQTSSGDYNEKFLQTEHQPPLQEIERQPTPRQAVSERTVIIISSQNKMQKLGEGRCNVYRYYLLQVHHNQNKYCMRNVARLIRFYKANKQWRYTISDCGKERWYIC